ncbi:MAG: endonuclease/exonuclease/phosphatase family protein [Pseudomonadota bacterium]
MRIATWNVNSLKVRLGHVEEWMSVAEPDVVALQEIKQVTADFPEAAFTEAGYRSIASGQKTYNGVAVVSKSDIQGAVTELPDFEDEQRRVLAVTTGGVRVPAAALTPYRSWRCGGCRAELAPETTGSYRLRAYRSSATGGAA